MIKKIIIITAVLFMIIVPCVLGDAAPPPMLASGKYLDIECEILTPEIGIGEDFRFRITIKNLTNSKIILNYIHSEFFSYVSLPSEDDKYWYTELKAYESITFEISENLESYRIKHGNVYKDGDSFYMDFQAEIEFNGESLYMYDDQIYPIKITNLHDGSDYIEYEWLDDKDTIYYFNSYIYDNIEYGREKKYLEGEVCYQLTYRNISGIYIEEIGSGEEIVENRCFGHTVLADEIDGTVELSRSWFFKLDGEYYMIFASREYKTEVLADKPDIGIVIQPIIDLNGNARYTYRMEVYSNEKRDIENFCVNIWGVASEGGKDYLMESGTLKPDESWIIEFGFDDIELFKSIMFGYYIGGDVYYWEPELELPILGYYEQNHIIKEIEYAYVYDFDYRIKEKQAQEKESDEDENFEIGTIQIGTPTPTAEIAPTPATTAENTPQIVAKNRDSSQMTIYVIIILALVIVAASFSILAMMKIYKEKEKTKE
ncbi:MAG: hypothetical protein AB1Z23_03295 [Eubacteriales bacterium]